VRRIGEENGRGQQGRRSMGDESGERDELVRRGGE
jgi:hypothetical protein